MSEINEIQVPEEDFFKAFLREIKPTGIFSQDEKQFNAFQKGWHAAMDWMNERVKEQND